MGRRFEFRLGSQNRVPPGGRPTHSDQLRHQSEAVGVYWAGPGSQKWKSRFQPAAGEE
jgi:hypothetical protein